jgi:hypothetical protein
MTNGTAHHSPDFPWRHPVTFTNTTRLERPHKLREELTRTLGDPERRVLRTDHAH